jgi:hypothetical protein
MDEDEDWADEAEGLSVVALVRHGLGHLPPERYDVGSSRFDPFVVDLTLLDTAALGRQAGLALGQDLKQALAGDIPGNWSVRVWVPHEMPSGSKELLVWLEIDRWRVAEFRGKKTSLAFDFSEDFQQAIWGG